MIVEPTVPREQHHIEDEIKLAPSASDRLHDELNRLDAAALGGPLPDTCGRCGHAGEVCWSHAAGSWVCEDCHGDAGGPF